MPVFYSLERRQKLFFWGNAGLAASAPAAGIATMELLRRCTSVDSPLAQDAFKLLAALLRFSNSTWTPSMGALRWLLGWTFADAEAAAQRAAPFGLLRAVLSRGLQAPEVFMLMERVQELLVCAQVRVLCAQHLAVGARRATEPFCFSAKAMQCLHVQARPQCANVV